MEAILLSREDKQEELFHTQGGGLSLKEKEERPQLSLAYMFVVSLENYWYGEIKSGKTGLTLTVTRYILWSLFSFMIWLNDNVWVSRY